MFSFIFGPKTQSKPSGRSLHAKDEETDAYEFASVDAALHSLEEGLESLFRQLIKTRVSLLNILNH
ncbi:hypothetical protein D8674_026899 [Pyrus ussuriensis x Pyrus communis]|uniref:Uncharacterized protein n=1 Tax=Pyrus ussuriensis x Pyrus communis TaxID=2448454 RepID=A0A5N5I854_9ROSA|nr:hypothetical protein D8674_026899 [Pyrus ussuriensis x Pyrus communis]